jgi:hypothetical protein
MVSYVSSNIHLHDTLYHTFAFINIHLDIHRIIIIITYKTCFGFERKGFGKKGKRGNFMLRCVRKEGKMFFAFGSKVLISSTPKNFIHGRKSKIILQSEIQLHHILYKLSQEFFEIFLQTIRASTASMDLRLFTLQLQLWLGKPVCKYYKLNSKFKGKGKHKI